MKKEQAAQKPATPNEAKPAAKPTSKAASAVAPDWERIELDYRAGIKSLREIADGSGVSHVTVSKRAKAHGWVRDLSKKIQAKADELVNKAMVNKPVNTASAVSERETIDANAQAVASVKMAHRKDIQRTRSITMALLEELELQTGRDTVIMLEQLGDMLRCEDDKGVDKLNDLYHKVISLPGRAKTMKDLGESLRVLVALERQAFGLDDKDGTPADALTSLLHGIAGRNGNAFMPVVADPDHQDED
jgi:hypothetical protein